MSNDTESPISSTAADGGSAMVINIPNTATLVTINTQHITLIQTTPTPTQPNPNPTPTPPTPIANLANLLPTASVLIFQATAPSLSTLNNTNLMASAIALNAIFCFFSSFTDSFVDTNLNIHYGIATRKGLYLFKWKERGLNIPKQDLTKFRLCFPDFVHATVSLLVFLAIAFSDTHVQFCFIPGSSKNDKEIMMNLPLAAWVFANFLFTLMPTTRRGIGFADKTRSFEDESSSDGTTPSGQKNPQTKILTTMGNLANLLPTTTVLAFQALTPSFSNNGNCRTSNKYFIASAIGLSSLICFVSSFTDSVTDEKDGKLYHGLATPNGLRIFTCTCSDQVKEKYMVMKRFRICWEDFVHAFVSLFVFLVVAFSDRDVNNCYFPKAEEEARGAFLMYLPLGASVFAGCLFAFVPTKRRGIGYANAAPNKI